MSFVMRWDRRWISGSRFARDYAASITAFTSDVSQAVTRVHRSKQGPVFCDEHTHAVVWAAVLVAFEAASFRDEDRETLLALLLEELRASWGHATGVLQRSEAYFSTRDRSSARKTSERIVSWYLRAIGLSELVGNSALARHLRAIFTHRILCDIYRLSAASRLRSAVVALIDRQRAARIADVDICGMSIWEPRAPAVDSPAPVPAKKREDSHWDGHPIEVSSRAGATSR